MKPDALLAEAEVNAEFLSVTDSIHTALSGLCEFLGTQRVTEPWLGAGDLWTKEGSKGISAIPSVLTRTLLPENYRLFVNRGRTLPLVRLKFEFRDIEGKWIRALKLDLAGGLLSPEGRFVRLKDEELDLSEVKHATDLNNNEMALSLRVHAAAKKLEKVEQVQETLDAFPVVARPFTRGKDDRQFYADVKASRGRPKPGKVTGQPLRVYVA